MKKILLVLTVFALAACSSKDEAAMVDTAPQAEPAAPAVPEPAPAPEPAPEVAAPAMDDMASGSGFPAITGTERMMANCTSGSDTRTIAVLDITGNNGCGVVYTKDGNPTTIAIARHDMSYCDKVFENVKNNLSSAGMDCGDGAGAAAPAPSPAKESTISEDAAGAMETAKEKVSEAVGGAMDKAKDAAESMKDGQ